MLLTPRYGLKKPEAADFYSIGVDGEPDYLADNYDIIDEWLPNKPASSVPGSSTTGRVYWDRAQRRLVVFNGSSTTRNIGGRRPSCLIRKTTNTYTYGAPAAVGYYPVPFEQEVWDTNGFWNIGQPTRLNFVEAGLYRVEYGLGYSPDGNATPDIDVVFPINGSSTLWHWRGPSGAAIYPLYGGAIINACRLFQANANDYMEMRLAANHINGYTIGSFGGGDNVVTYFKVLKLS